MLAFLHLGFQVLGCVALISIGLYFFGKAFSDEVNRRSGDSAFICYLLCGFGLFGLGFALLFAVGLFAL